MHRIKQLIVIAVFVAVAYLTLAIVAPNLFHGYPPGACDWEAPHLSDEERELYGDPYEQPSLKEMHPELFTDDGR